MPTSLPITTRPLAEHPAERRFVPLRLGALATAWRRIAARYRQRCALAELDARLLDDIGKSRAEAEEECRKPPWR